MTRIRETPEFMRGRDAERVVASVLRGLGWHVIVSADFSGEQGACVPRLNGTKTQFVLPDLDISKGGERYWVEVKWRAETTTHHITGRVEHGFAKRLHDSYLGVQEETGTPIALCVVEGDTGDILIAPLDWLADGTRHYDGDAMDKGGMVFFLRDDFTRIGTTRAPRPSRPRQPGLFGWGEP